MSDKEFEDFEDVVVGEEETPTEKTAEHPAENLDGLPDDPSKLPASVLEELSKEKPVLGQSEEEMAEEELNKLRKENREKEMRQKYRDQALLELIKEKPEVRKAAPAFLKDMAGIEQYNKTYKRMGMVTANFKTLSADDLQQIEKQYARDAISGRIIFQAEVRFNAMYRLAAACSEIVITDPQTNKIFRTYTPDSHEEQIKDFKHEELEDYDTPLRRRALYLIQEFLKNGTIYEQISNMFIEFEMHLNDLAVLASEDPDFFQKCLAEA